MSNFLVVFVCTGNICRSPMAEGILKDLVLDEFEKRSQVIPVEIMSAGVYAMDGNPASHFAIEVTAQHGINLNFHRSRHITEKLVKRADLILTMDESHSEYISLNWPNIGYVHELKKFDSEEMPENTSSGIMDPIGLDIETYEKIFNELEREIKRVSQMIFSLAMEKYSAQEKK